MSEPLQLHSESSLIQKASSPEIDFPQTHKAKISLSFSVSIDLCRIHLCPLNIILLHSYHEQSLVTNGLDQ